MNCNIIRRLMDVYKELYDNKSMNSITKLLNNDLYKDKIIRFLDIYCKYLNNDNVIEKTQVLEFIYKNINQLNKINQKGLVNFITSHFADKIFDFVEKTNNIPLFQMEILKHLDLLSLDSEKATLKLELTAKLSYNKVT